MATPGGRRDAQPGSLGALRRLLGDAPVHGGRDLAVHPAGEVGAHQELPEAHHQAEEGGSGARRHRTGVQGAGAGSLDEGGRREAEATPGEEQDRRLQVPEPQEGANRASVRGIGRLAEGQRRTPQGAAEATSRGSAPDVPPATARMHRHTGGVGIDRGLSRRWGKLPLMSLKRHSASGRDRCSVDDSKSRGTFAYTVRSLYMASYVACV